MLFRVVLCYMLGFSNIFRKFLCNLIYIVRKVLVLLLLGLYGLYYSCCYPFLVCGIRNNLLHRSILRIVLHILNTNIPRIHLDETGHICILLFQSNCCSSGLVHILDTNIHHFLANSRNNMWRCLHLCRCNNHLSPNLGSVHNRHRRFHAPLHLVNTIHRYSLSNAILLLLQLVYFQILPLCGELDI